MVDYQDADGSMVPEILGHYAEAVERDRRFEERIRLERVRTQELLARHLLPPPAVILDVGGGPSVYTPAGSPIRGMRSISSTQCRCTSSRRLHS